MDYIPNGQLKRLVQLQEIDSQINEIVEKQKSLPLIIASLRVNLDRDQGILADSKRDYEDAVKEHRSLEGLLKDAEEKIRKLKGRTIEIKTNKEYQALLKEIETAGQETSDIEEKILVLLENMDVLKATCKEKELIVAEEEKVFQGEKEKKEAEFELLSEKLKKFESERSEIISQVDPRLMSEYSRLLSTRRGQAVAVVKDEYCLGCHMRVPPQIFTEIRKNDKIMHCLSCQRILYWKPN